MGQIIKKVHKNSKICACHVSSDYLRGLNKNLILQITPTINEYVLVEHLTSHDDMEELFSMEKEESLRMCEVGGRNAYFHKWVEKSQIIPPSSMVGGHGGGVVTSSLGIVEFEDGTVEEHFPHTIIFRNWSE